MFLFTYVTFLVTAHVNSNLTQFVTQSSSKKIPISRCILSHNEQDLYKIYILVLHSFIYIHIVNVNVMYILVTHNPPKEILSYKPNIIAQQTNCLKFL